MSTLSRVLPNDPVIQVKYAGQAAIMSAEQNTMNHRQIWFIHWKTRFEHWASGKIVLMNYIFLKSAEH